jgi:ArsR family transcriptional regulator, arsenate/arsenite/antimonite-responsive transcriptional repressor
MPLELKAPLVRGVLRVSVSAPCELLWVMVYLHRGQGVPDVPALKPIRDNYQSLSRRSRALWEDPKAEYTEILVLAEQGGTLENAEAEPFLASLEKVAARPVADLTLPSETPEVRAAIEARLKRLLKSSDFRRRYHDLLETVWGLMKPGWRRDGRPLVERTAAAWQREVNAGRQLRQILFNGHIYFHCKLIGPIERKFPTVLTPSFFSSRGGHVVVLPRLIHVAAGVGPEDVSEALWHRAEALAKQMKVLADPTRLAILLHLTDGSYTVSEMAARFEVSQPTVSGHIKALRDEGLVEARRNGQRMPYAANRERIATVMRDVEQALQVEAVRKEGDAER